jgi:predicted nucleic acid-binding protein
VKIALDTNVLAYAEGVDGAERKAVALEVLAAISSVPLILPVQVLGELFHVLVRKGRSREAARAAVATWRDSCETFETTAEVLSRAFDLAVDHHVSTWDAVILSAASGAGCRLLLSEDMHEGFSWGGTMVLNPFAVPQHPLMNALLYGGR